MTPQPPVFDPSHSTRWSLIHELDASGADGRSRFSALCLRYWNPVHRYLLERGHGEAVARRLTQGFFARLDAGGLARAAAYSRFRDFLTGELEGFLAEQAEAKDGVDSAPPAPPPRPAPVGGAASLERGLALEVVAHSMARLRREAVQAGHLPMFERLQHYLSIEPQAGDLQREAVALEATPLFVSLAIRRLRQRFRRIVDDELTQLVTDPAQLAEERAAMFAALARPS